MLSNKINFLKQINSDFLTLYVEDNEETRKETIEILENFLPAVISANNGEDGINLYKKHIQSKKLNAFDLIISDIKMPKLNGLDMIKEIKQLTPSIPVIILSAYNNKNYFLDAINVIGVDSFLIKPFSLNELINVLFRIIYKQYQKDIFVLQDVFMEIENDIISIGKNYYYDYLNASLFYKGSMIKLSKNEHLFLKILIDARGRNVSFNTIEHLIWPDSSINNHSLRSLVYRLRSKINPEIIVTIPSFGYKLSVLT